MTAVLTALADPAPQPAAVPPGMAGLIRVDGRLVTTLVPAGDATVTEALALAARRRTPLLIDAASAADPAGGTPLPLAGRPEPWVPVVVVGRHPWSVAGADLAILLGTSGPADHTVASPADAAALARRFLSLLGTAAAPAPPAGVGPLTEVVPFGLDGPYRMAAVLDAVLDAPGLFPLGEPGAVLGGLAGVDGRTVVVLASEPGVDGGRLSRPDWRTVARLTTLAADAGLPLVGFVDSAGLADGAGPHDAVAADELWAALDAAWATPATQVTIVVGRAHGPAALLLGAVGARADVVTAWPRATFAAAEPTGAAARELASVWATARDGALLDIIGPDETRRTLIELLDVLRGARRFDRG